MRYPSASIDDGLSRFIEKHLAKSTAPLETPEVIKAARSVNEHAGRSAVLLRLRLLEQAGKIHSKQLSAGAWVWWV